MIRFETQLVSWELTDEYGWPLSGDSAKSITRDMRIDDLLEEEGEYQNCLYQASLESKESGLEHYKICWETKTKKLTLWTIMSGGNRELRISLNSETIHGCDALVQLLMDSNDLKLMPVCIPEK